MDRVSVRPIQPADAETLARMWEESWGGSRMVVHGVVYDADRLPGFLAAEENEIVGAVTYHLQGDQCEIVSLDSRRQSRGIGTALIEAVKRAAREAGCNRLWLITTNDNVHALRFYQRRGFELVAVHRHAVDKSRQIKPSIPLVGNDGIPIRDEIEMEITLVSGQAGA